MTSLISCKSFFIFELTLGWSIPVQKFRGDRSTNNEDTGSDAVAPSPPPPPPHKPKDVKKAQSDHVSVNSKPDHPSGQIRWNFFERANSPRPGHKERAKPQSLGQKNRAKMSPPGQSFSKIQQKTTKHETEIMQNSTEMLISDMSKNILTLSGPAFSVVHQALGGAQRPRRKKLRLTSTD